MHGAFGYLIIGIKRGYLFKTLTIAKHKKNCYNDIMLKKGSLACSVCGSRNYSIELPSAGREKRLEIKKFCKHCKEHTLHKETR